MSEDTTPRIVTAVASATARQGKDRELSKLLEAADVAAINACIADGVNLHDAEKILERKRDFRYAAKQEYAERQERERLKAAAEALK